MFPHLKRFFFLSWYMCGEVLLLFCSLLLLMLHHLLKIYIFIVASWMERKEEAKESENEPLVSPSVSSSGRSPYFRRWLANTVLSTTGLWGLITDVTTTIPSFLSALTESLPFFFFSFGANRAVCYISR